MFAHHPVTNKKYFFVDKYLPFGSSISCSHFQRFSNSIAHLFKFVMNKDTDNYLDDFLFTALLKAMCDGQVQVFLDIFKSINFPAVLDKTFLGTQVIMFLGILINTITQTVSVPSEKIDKTLNQI